MSQWMRWVLKFSDGRTRELEEVTFKRSVEGSGSREMEHSLYFELEKKQVEIWRIPI